MKEPLTGESIVVRPSIDEDLLERKETMVSSLSRDTLVEQLRKHGITFLAGGEETGETTDLPVDDVITSLVVSEDPRLRLALIPFFVLHPETARNVATLVERLPATSALDLQTFYTAAVYLQRLWWTRLHFYRKDLPALPDLYSQALGLPPAEERHGKVGLYTLAAWHTRRSAYPFNRLASYQKVMDLLFEQLKLEARE
ncbi:MAG: hypothetical protein HY709_11375 [Candidatus Latescibacteria bacterium]|nr:hypothetical protein [Candidatus Latescibacterota bacterium]